MAEIHLRCPFFLKCSEDDAARLPELIREGCEAARKVVEVFRDAMLDFGP